jgi:hypothetical protein
MCKRLVCVLSFLLVLGAAGAAWGELVGHWKLDEGAGNTAADSSGKGNDGTFVNNPTWIDGVLGAALEFHGDPTVYGGKDYINCGNDASLDVRSGISITLWIRPGADDPEGKGTAGGETAPMAKAMDPDWNWQVRYGWGSPKPYMAFTFNTSPRAWAYVNKNLTRDEWCHIACSHDGTTLKCYLNGEQTDSTPMGAIAGGNMPVLIGSDGWGCDWLGAIDDVRIYNHGLTWDEIAELCPPSRTAKEPEPADGAVGVVSPLLRWKAGYKGVLHEVYLGTSPDLGPDNLVQPRAAMLFYYHIPGLQPGTTYFWRVDEIEEDLTTVNTGHVWSFTTQALTAYLPVPADGAVDASLTPTLSWQPGQAALKHHLYFSDSNDAVAQGAAAADKGELELADATFAPGELQPVTTYFWRVDEIAFGDAVRTGPVWSFTTYLPVDDFESYNDEENQGTRIYETWIDGWVNDNGATVGYLDPPFAEQKTVHGGLQSMPLDYNNIADPFYSEAVREFTSAQDWTVNDANMLILNVQGKTANAPAPLYVMLEDASRRSATVIHPDTAVVATAKWTEWRIPLADFTGVDAARIKKIYIGVGDKADPAPGGTGLIFIDDIWVIRPSVKSE